MANRTTINEIQLIHKLLDTLPKDVQGGTLPYKDWEKENSIWKELRKKHPFGSLCSLIRREYKKRILPVKSNLNHAYNFCPSCGFKLN